MRSYAEVFTEWALWADSVIELPCLSVFLSVCLSAQSQNTHFNVLLRFLFEDFFLNMWIWTVGELVGESLWLWLLTVGCLHFNDTSMALQWHFNVTSMLLPRHIHGTSTALQWHTKNRNRKKKLYCCFYPHQSRDSVSPICGIFIPGSVDSKSLPDN